VIETYCSIINGSENALKSTAELINKAENQYLVHALTACIGFLKTCHLFGFIF
jgi:hypothetical protein